MKPIYTIRLLSAALVGALVLLVSCGPTTAAQPTPIATATTIPAAATALPAATSAPAITTAPTAAPTAIPTATATSQPTTEPTVSAEPTATPAPTSLLPNDIPWVHSAGTIFADDETFDLVKHGLPAPAYQFQVAPDGTMIAYLSRQDHLIVADIRTSQAILDDGPAVMATGFAFAPDGHALAYGTPEGQLNILDLPSGERHPIALSEQPAPQNRPTTILMPIAWTNTGLYAQQVIWGSDALPQGIVHIDPANGMVTPIRTDTHLSAFVSPDEKRIALITGSVPIGAQQITGITLLDIASGQATPLVPEQPQLIRSLRWSPDGTQLLYASVANYDTVETKLQVISTGAKAPAGPAKESLVLDTYRDIAWGGAQPLLLTIEKDGLLHLYWVEMNDQGIISLAPSAALVAPTAEQVDGQIIYAPQ